MSSISLSPHAVPYTTLYRSAYNEQTEQTIRDDFNRLWATSFLDDLRIEVTDYTFSNGVVGKLVAYHMEERERVKIVNRSEEHTSELQSPSNLVCRLLLDKHN